MLRLELQKTAKNCPASSWDEGSPRPKVDYVWLLGCTDPGMNFKKVIMEKSIQLFNQLIFGEHLSYAKYKANLGR